MINKSDNKEESRPESQTDNRTAMASFDPHEFLKKVTGKDLVVSNEEPVKELMSLMNDSPNRGEELFAQVPQVNSSLFEKVKGLPAREGQAFFLRTETNARSSQLKEASGGVDISMYRVFTVDLAKFESTTKINQQKKAFDQIKMVFCDKKESRVKHLIGAVADACIEPSIMPASFFTNPAPSYRPGTVFLETKADVSQPQIQLFFKLMGCHDVRVLTMPMCEVLEDNLDEITETSTRHNMVDAKQMPHLHDYWEGIICEHCQKTGPTLRCPCKQGYYCDPVCQEAHWNEHKAQHRATLASRSRKKKAKTKECLC
jgi:hypothetical protein